MVFLNLDFLSRGGKSENVETRCKIDLNCNRR